MFRLADFLLYSFITAYTPGINNLLSMSNAARFGLRRGLRFNLGIAIGFFMVMSICAIFSSSLFTLLPKIMIFMQIFGAAYMLFLAWKIWRSPAALETDNAAEAGVRAGLLLQFMNPKIYIYAITTMSLYILPVYSSPAALAGFTLILTLIGTSGCLVWALFGSAFCRLMAQHTKAVNSIMALLLIYCAVSLFL